MHRLNIGIVGYRNHSLKIIKILFKSNYVKKINCYCYKKNICGSLNKKYKKNNINFSNKYSDLFVSDVFFITSPSNTHNYYIKKLIKFKKPIFCEKTGLTSISQLRFYKNIDINLRRKIYFNYNFIFTKIFKDLEKLITKKNDKLNHISIFVSNGIYNLKKFKNDWRFLSKSRLERITGNLGSHYLFFLITLFGRPIKLSVEEKAYEKNKIHTAIINIKFINDITATLFFSYSTPMIDKMEFIFDNKLVLVDDLKMSVFGPRNTFSKNGLFKTPKLINKYNYNKNTNEISLEKSISFFLNKCSKKQSFNKKNYVTALEVAKLLLSK